MLGISNCAQSAWTPVPPAPLPFTHTLQRLRMQSVPTSHWISPRAAGVSTIFSKDRSSQSVNRSSSWPSSNTPGSSSGVQFLRSHATRSAAAWYCSCTSGVATFSGGMTVNPKASSSARFSSRSSCFSSRYNAGMVFPDGQSSIFTFHSPGRAVTP